MKNQFAGLIFIVILFSFPGCKKNEPAPTADFRIDATNNFYAPCTVSLINKSTDAFSYEWSFFPMDSVFSTDTNAVVDFVKEGTYSIKLRAFTQSRKEWASSVKTVKILKSTGKSLH